MAYIKRPLFHGPGQEPEDEQRLLSGLEFIRKLMLDGQWRTLPEICQLYNDRTGKGMMETTASAALRTLRRSDRGGYLVDREKKSAGLFVYRVRRRTIGRD